MGDALAQTWPHHAEEDSRQSAATHSRHLRPESIDTHEVVWEAYVGERVRTAVSAYRYTASQLVDLRVLDPDALGVGKLVLAATRYAKAQGLAENGYRCVMNCNRDGGQTVFHLHLHLLAGRAMQWPPG